MKGVVKMIVRETKTGANDEWCVKMIEYVNEN